MESQAKYYMLRLMPNYSKKQKTPTIITLLEVIRLLKLHPDSTQLQIRSRMTKGGYVRKVVSKLYRLGLIEISGHKEDEYVSYATYTPLSPKYRIVDESLMNELVKELENKLEELEGYQ